jgi:hypothetical protein
MENLYQQAKDQAEKMQRTIQRLANDISMSEHKISILDKTVFSCEQERKRTEQRVQELTDKKDRIEKFIANILNGEVYSKLQQIVKENVKAVLFDNKILVSAAFAAIIETLKIDPQMVNVIHNISTMNHGEQDKNNNNITTYPEVNKNSLLDLAEKHYENLVEALTNNALDTSSSNPTLSSQQSLSSIFPKLSNQSDKYRIEQSESFRNSKGDIAD